MTDETKGDNAAVNSTHKSTRVFGASVIGPLHAQSKLPCQDACAYQVLASGTILIAVADGLGSATLSETGANLAVAAGIHALEAMLSEDARTNREEIVRRAARAARQALGEHEARSGCQLRDLACTLILALLENTRVTVAHIGDGAVVADLCEQYRTVSDPGDSEFANEVTPLTSADWEKQLRTTTLEGGVRGIAVFTDGCQRAAFRKSESGLAPFDGFFRPIFSFAREVENTADAVQEIEALLGCDKICNNSDDDKTLVIAVTNASHMSHD